MTKLTHDLYHSYSVEMILAIVGSQNFNKYDELCHTIDDLISECSDESVMKIVSGAETGVVVKYAVDHNYAITMLTPDLNQYGKDAVHMMNKFMVNESDYVLAFWDGISSDIMSIVKMATEASKTVKIVFYTSHHMHERDEN